LRRTQLKNRKPQHTGTRCNKCRMIPIRGKLFACVLCGGEKIPVMFCEQCYTSPDRPHQNHPFLCQAKAKGVLTMAPDRLDISCDAEAMFPLNIFLAKLLAEWEPTYARWKESHELSLLGRAELSCAWECSSSPRDRGRLVRLPGMELVIQGRI